MTIQGAETAHFLISELIISLHFDFRQATPNDDIFDQATQATDMEIMSDNNDSVSNNGYSSDSSDNDKDEGIKIRSDRRPMHQFVICIRMCARRGGWGRGYSCLNTFALTLGPNTFTNHRKIGVMAIQAKKIH